MLKQLSFAGLPRRTALAYRSRTVLRSAPIQEWSSRRRRRATPRHAMESAPRPVAGRAASVHPTCSCRTAPALQNVLKADEIHRALRRLLRRNFCLFLYFLWRIQIAKYFPLILFMTLIGIGFSCPHTLKHFTVHTLPLGRDWQRGRISEKIIRYSLS